MGGSGRQRTGDDGMVGRGVAENKRNEKVCQEARLPSTKF